MRERKREGERRGKGRRKTERDGRKGEKEELGKIQEEQKRKRR